MADTNLKIVITTEDKSSASLGKIESAVKSLAGAYIGIKGLEAAFKFLTDSMAEAAEEEKSLNLLNTALKNSGQEAETLTKKLNDYATQMQFIVRFTDNELRNSMRQFIQFGMSATESQIALNSAMDLAVAKNMDLGSATNILGKAYKGNTELLKRYGIEAEDFNSALQQISGTMGGSAKNELTGYAKQLNELEKQWNEFKEAIGKPATTASIPLLQALNDALKHPFQYLLTGGASMYVNALAKGAGILPNDRPTGPAPVTGGINTKSQWNDQTYKQMEKDAADYEKKRVELARNAAGETVATEADRVTRMEAMWQAMRDHEVEATRAMWEGIINVAGSASNAMTALGVASNDVTLKGMGIVLKGVETTINAVNTILKDPTNPISWILGILGFVGGVENMKTQFDTLDRLTKENQSTLLQYQTPVTSISSTASSVDTSRPESIERASAPIYNNYNMNYNINAGIMLGDKSEIEKAFDTLMQAWQRNQALRVA